MYSVFLVEDEFRIRENIRESLQGEELFTFIGEASDGEMALTQICELKPDILITDIKMPFMDGLSLSRIVKRTMPWIHIIIISGHDEFEYAQNAISMGVDAYLLKPIRYATLLTELNAAADAISKSRQEFLSISRLRSKISFADEAQKDGLLEELLIGGGDTAKLIERADEAGINLLCKNIVVLYFDIENVRESYYVLRTALVSQFAADPEILFYYHLPDQLIMFIKGETPEALLELAYAFAQGVKYELEKLSDCRVNVGIGTVKNHISDINQSYLDAKAAMNSTKNENAGQILSFGDLKTQGFKNDFLAKAKEYILENHQDPSITLIDVAKCVNLSPNHFSTVFSQRTGQTVIEYLTTVRIEHAKELLKNPTLKQYEISEAVGYNEPHYFSFIFKKYTGVSPRDYRTSAK